MIRQAGPGDEAALLAVLRAAPAHGAQLEVDWRLKQDNPAMPWLFYLAVGGAAIKLEGGLATVCGPVEDAAELEAFLDMQAVAGVESAGWHPAGWPAEPLVLMEWAGTPNGPGGGAVAGGGPAGCPTVAGGGPAMPGGVAGAHTAAVFDPAPPPGEVLAVLESSRPITPPARRGRYYAALCARLSRGLAAVFGMREEGRLVSVAQAAAITGARAHLAGVETRPEARGNGYAAALVARLCRDLAPRQVSLLCRPALAGYYRRLGFEENTAGAVWAQRPGTGPGTL